MLIGVRHRLTHFDESSGDSLIQAWIVHQLVKCCSYAKSQAILTHFSALTTTCKLLDTQISHRTTRV
ncbi:hypothetical protein DUNSADRAFT_10711 [Dunaliella salina]|uniref:Encoded protein n=1 Tax=Dunaliella salina TaxID=3046 RepID=A0ABQ7GEQ4_DUNSA|nr:hypothetical protein DUNSADRAFT_10711 [Dunaliella salina]|eukprot:KAF5833092.1 hypothetical protein DUNSADRAFT_10711 [Dunaliella salina]